MPVSYDRKGLISSISIMLHEHQVAEQPQTIPADLCDSNPRLTGQGQLAPSEGLETRLERPEEGAGRCRAHSCTLWKTYRWPAVVEVESPAAT